MRSRGLTSMRHVGSQKFSGQAKRSAAADRSRHQRAGRAQIGRKLSCLREEGRVEV